MASNSQASSLNHEAQDQNRKQNERNSPSGQQGRGVITAAKAKENSPSQASNQKLFEDASLTKSDSNFSSSQDFAVENRKTEKELEQCILSIVTHSKTNCIYR